MTAPNGLVLCTGPLGSGKTTTLYSCLQDVGGPGRKVVTVEDPVEYVLPWATQVAVAVQQGLTFASVLRAFLRADPDVVMIAEPLVMSPEIGRALRVGESPQRLHEIACSQGMVPMAANGLMCVATGETTLAELRG